MAKILTFRNKGGSPSDQDFLTDENQTLSFRTSEDGGVSLGNLTKIGFPDLFPNPKKDWSNQELADLFRVRQLLSSANVSVETDRGVTDEGDPWFVFCHTTGEIFIHLCRIDGIYLLDSPNVLRPLRGADFSALIADFTNQTLPAQGPKDETERRVIRLERGGKVRLHPSAMLAALIWTLFLASEELVLLAPEEETENTDTLLDFRGMFAIDGAEHSIDDAFFEDYNLDATHSLKNDSYDTEHVTTDTQGHMREASLHQQGLTVHNNAFTMGLSTIAIAMGFMSETVLLDNQRKVLEGLKELGLSGQLTEDRRLVALDIPADEENSPLLPILADFLGIELFVETELAEASMDGVDVSMLQKDLKHVIEESHTEAPSLSEIKGTAKIIRRDVEDHHTSPVERTDAPTATDPHNKGVTEISDKDAATDEVRHDAGSLTWSEIVLAWQPKMEEFQLGQTTVKASFDFRDMDDFGLLEWIDTQSTKDGNTQVTEFESIVMRMMDFLQDKSANIGVIELSSGSGLIFVDRDAVAKGDIDSMHWESTDGKIISLIGFESDLQQFDMIA